MTDCVLLRDLHSWVKGESGPWEHRCFFPIPLILSPFQSLRLRLCCALPLGLYQLEIACRAGGLFLGRLRVCHGALIAFAIVKQSFPGFMRTMTYELTGSALLPVYRHEIMALLDLWLPWSNGMSQQSLLIPLTKSRYELQGFQEQLADLQVLQEQEEVAALVMSKAYVGLILCSGLRSDPMEKKFAMGLKALRSDPEQDATKEAENSLSIMVRPIPIDYDAM
ncbi:hypothetical protein Tco_0339641 [Tanacetum coccineum]